MDLLRRKALRAASLILILAALAAPAYAFTGAPGVTLNPDSGDPDIGDGRTLRNVHHVLVFSLGRLLTPTTPWFFPRIHSTPTPSRQSRR